jgi:hypothetical protein
MQAITTRVIPASNTRPTRIKAECARGSITIPYPDGAGEAAHRFAARLLCERFATEDAKEYGVADAGKNWLRTFETGQSKDGHYQHVFTKEV